MREVIATSGVGPLKFTAKAGDMSSSGTTTSPTAALEVTREGATRRSLVGHYFADDVLCYHEVTERAALMPAGFD